MAVLFEKTIRRRLYKFLHIDYLNSNEPVYTIEFVTDEDKKTVRFRMKKNTEGHWKIQAQRLPDYVYQSEHELEDAIADGEAKGKTTNLSDDFSPGE
jgi:hypothetical protein